MKVLNFGSLNIDYVYKLSILFPRREQYYLMTLNFAVVRDLISLLLSKGRS